MTDAPPPPPEPVAAAYDAWPGAARARGLQLRALILEVAAETPGVGPLEETLKWGEPAYLTAATGAGSTVRVGWSPKRPEICGLFLNCRTDLIARARELYDGRLRFEGARGILVGLDDPLDREALKHCVALALTHHLRRRTKSASRA